MFFLKNLHIHYIKLILEHYTYENHGTGDTVACEAWKEMDTKDLDQETEELGKLEMLEDCQRRILLVLSQERENQLGRSWQLKLAGLGFHPEVQSQDLTYLHH